MGNFYGGPYWEGKLAPLRLKHFVEQEIRLCSSEKFCWLASCPVSLWKMRLLSAYILQKICIFTEALAIWKETLKLHWFNDSYSQINRALKHFISLTVKKKKSLSEVILTTTTALLPLWRHYFFTVTINIALSWWAQVQLVNYLLLNFLGAVTSLIFSRTYNCFLL